jgi:proteasome-associated ATPase
MFFPLGESAPNQDEQMRQLAALRADPGLAPHVDRMLLERIRLLQQGIQECRKVHKRLEGVVEKLTAPAWFTALFLCPIISPKGPKALVQVGQNRRVVTLAEEVDIHSLHAGDEVFLSSEMNAVVAKAPALARTGETCYFERKTAQGQLVIKCRDEEYLVAAPPALWGADLRPGDQLCWDRNALIALCRMERPQTSQWFLEETPAQTFGAVGGLGSQITQIQEAILLHLKHADVARKYRLARTGSILLHGPVGTGKTMLARALANWLATLMAAGKARFMNIKPASLHSMWYSESERNYREVFRLAREAAVAQPDIPVVMFFDEVDAIGALRGQSHLRVHDNVLTAFLAELDGLEGRGNILVVGATNRREVLDPALLRQGRLGDLMLEVPRPNRRAAADIFGKHLPPDIPYAQNGHGSNAPATRAEFIESAVARVYSPNGDSELATLTFRDGKRQVVRAADLISGAVIAGIARRATERACLREVQTGQEGLRLEDLFLAIRQEFESAASVLSPANCRHHLSGLPQDSDIVKVEPVTRKVARPERYLNQL